MNTTRTLNDVNMSTKLGVFSCPFCATQSCLILRGKNKGYIYCSYCDIFFKIFVKEILRCLK